MPIKYGNGPLYRNVYKLAPKDTLTHAESPVLRMLMVRLFAHLCHFGHSDSTMACSLSAFSLESLAQAKAPFQTS